MTTSHYQPQRGQTTSAVAALDAVIPAGKLGQERSALNDAMSALNVAADALPPESPPPAGGSVLADAAAALSPGQSAPITLGGHSAALWAVGPHSLMDFGNAAEHDESTGQIHFLSQTHTSSVLTRATYDEATDQWTRYDGSYPDTAVWVGHPYRHTAAHGGEIWGLESGGNSRVRELQGGVWVDIGPGIPQQVSGAIQWTPWGLFIASPNGATIGGTVTAQTASLYTHMTAAYSPAQQRVVFGGGNINRLVYWCDNVAWGQVDDAPVSYGAHADMAALLGGSLDAPYIVARDGSVYRLTGDSWSLAGQGPARPDKGFHVACYGCILTVRQDGTAELFRP